jgi:hypothetical protein
LRLQRYSAETCGVPKDKSRVQEQLNVYYVLPAMATCFVAARVFIRTKLEVGLGADDWMMIAALAAYLTDVGTGLGIALYGFGQHTFVRLSGKSPRLILRLAYKKCLRGFPPGTSLTSLWEHF